MPSLAPRPCPVPPGLLALWPRSKAAPSTPAALGPEILANLKGPSLRENHFLGRSWAKEGWKQICLGSAGAGCPVSP